MDLVVKKKLDSYEDNIELTYQEIAIPTKITPKKEVDWEIEHARWFGFKGLKIDSLLFRKGLVYVHASSSTSFITSLDSSDALMFSLNGRKLAFAKKKQFSHEKQSRTLTKQINSICGSDVEDDGDNEEVIVNLERRQEIFYPLRFNGIYVYPWLSKTQNVTTKFSLSAFKQFFTVGCMFGSALKGMDNLGRTFEVVKHDIKFFPEQRIEAIVFSSEECNPYEEVLFEELNVLANLMAKLAKSKDARNLYYHLPYYDYMLFGVELFIRGRMTFEALDQFFTAIFYKQNEYREKIQAICLKDGIKVRIESPFENLFGPLLEERETTKSILELLEIKPCTVMPELDQQQSKFNEQALVLSCLQKLQDNSFNELHQKVWSDFIKVAQEINDLEGLFKIANAIMLGLASQGRQDYETCALLPVSEKQIAISYEGYCKLIHEMGYPGVVNLTTMEPVISHDHSSKGLLFYFNSCSMPLSLAIEKGLLQAAHANASLSEKQPKQELKQILGVK